MRTKIVFVILLAGALGIGGIFYLKRASAPSPRPAAEKTSTTTNIVKTISVPAVTATSTPVMTPEQHEAAVQAEIDRLQEWEMSDEPSALSNILGDLTSPEKEIRDAAIEATKQFGSTNAIPVLKAIAANTPDTDEQIALLDAAKFLSLPSITAGGIQSPTPEQRNAATQAVARSKRNYGASGPPPSPQP